MNTATRLLAAAMEASFRVTAGLVMFCVCEKLFTTFLLHAFL